MPVFPAAVMAVAAGVPQLANVNPVKFSKKMTVKFYQDSLAPKIATTEYEGEIKDMGSEIEIRVLMTPRLAITPRAAQRQCTMLIRRL